MRKLDIDVLRAAQERSGSTAAEIIRPLLVQYSDPQMRRAILSLAGEGYLKLDRAKAPHTVFVHITKRGREAIA